MLVPYSGAYEWGYFDSVTFTMPGMLEEGTLHARRLEAEMV